MLENLYNILPSSIKENPSYNGEGDLTTFALVGVLAAGLTVVGYLRSRTKKGTDEVNKANQLNKDHLPDDSVGERRQRDFNNSNKRP